MIPSTARSVFAGGPVEIGAGFILHSAEYHQADTISIDGRIAMSSAPELLSDLGHHKGPAKVLFAIGYAGWAPDQLESEIARKDWFTRPPTRNSCSTTTASFCGNTRWHGARAICRALSDERFQRSTVIPANAGIQSHKRDVGVCGPWMPAFAGMTA